MLKMILADKLLTTENGFILFVGLILGIIFGSLMTYLIVLGMFKDRDE